MGDFDEDPPKRFSREILKTPRCFHGDWEVLTDSTSLEGALAFGKTRRHLTASNMRAASTL
jgi:hypothetical protein